MIWLHCLTNTFSSTFNLSIMKKIFKSLFFSLLALVPMGMQAQKLHYNAGLETSHLWRGLEVGNGLIFNNDVSISDNNGHFKFGLWGGMSTDGDYKEADVYFNFNHSGFNLAVWDLWNFSEGIPGNGKYFTWAADRTSHLTDVAISYDFKPMCNFPLTLTWATLVQGRDRGELARYTENGPGMRKGEIIAEERPDAKNVYSTFVQAAFRLYEDENWNVDASVAGSFALSPYKKEIREKYNLQNNLYGKSAGVTDVRLGATYKLKIGKYTLPVGGQMMWNPEASKAYFRATVTLLDI
jgi:hypothetical protein